MENRIAISGSPHDAIWIQAVMRFPTDQYLRESWYAVEFARGHLAGATENDRFTLDEETLTRLIDAPAYEELKEKTILATKKGIVAGDILASIYLMDRFKIPEPSIKKATHIAQRFASNTEFGDGTRMNRSRKKIREALNEYRTVAHLWAAFRINAAYPYAAHRELLFSELPVFLEVSKALLEFGTAFVPWRSNPAEPILPSGEMWQLPEGIAARHLTSDHPPSGLTDLLADYDASEYSYTV